MIKVGTKQNRAYLLHGFVDLNGSYYETLDSPPNATEFMRLVHVSRPVVIKGKEIPYDGPLQCKHAFGLTGFRVPAHDNWTNEYLIQEMGDRPISVAVTPNGYKEYKIDSKCAH